MFKAELNPLWLLNMFVQNPAITLVLGKFNPVLATKSAKT
jgi:hypothetical protein